MCYFNNEAYANLNLNIIDFGFTVVLSRGETSYYIIIMTLKTLNEIPPSNFLE